MYSDMSTRMRDASSSNRNSASVRASSVFPTPVGPRKMNEPIGRFGSLRPARLRRMAFEMAVRAFSWPTTRFRSSSSIRTTGIPTIIEITAATDSPSTTALISSFDSRQFL